MLENWRLRQQMASQASENHAPYSFFVDLGARTIQVLRDKCRSVSMHKWFVLCQVVRGVKEFFRLALSLGTSILLALERTYYKLTKNGCF